MFYKVKKNIFSLEPVSVGLFSVLKLASENFSTNPHFSTSFLILISKLSNEINKTDFGNQKKN